MFGFTVRDAIWLILLAAMAACWYADRSILANKVRNLEIGIEIRDSNLKKQSRPAVAPDTPSQ